MGSEPGDSTNKLIDEIITLRKVVEESVVQGLAVLTLEEAAGFLRVSERTVRRRAVEEGKIAYSQPGGDHGDLRFLHSDLLKHLRASRVPTVEEARAKRR